MLYSIWEIDNTWIALGAITTVVYSTRIDADHVHLKGCGARFLEGLPEFLRRSRAAE